MCPTQPNLTHECVPNVLKLSSDVNECQLLKLGMAVYTRVLARELGRAAQVDCINTRVENAYGLSACSYNMMTRFETLLSNPTCAATARGPRAGERSVPRVLRD